MRKKVVAAVLAALLGACGGGGDGGGGTSTSTGSSVTVAITAPSSIDVEMFEGGTMRKVTITGTASGDVASLSGKTLYVVVVDPDSLFQATPAVSAGGANSLNVDLTGAVQSTPKHLVGNLTIHACLDAACTQPLGGSPMHVPYDVDVLAGITVDTTPISVSYVFGDPRSVRSLAVTLPKHLTTWSATALDVVGSPSFYAVAQTGQSGTDGTVTVNFAPTIAGVYTGKIRVDAG